MRAVRADSLAFLAKPGMLPEKGNVLSGEIPPGSILHVTAAPPFMATLSETLLAVDTFVGRLLSDDRVSIIDNRSDLEIKDDRIKIILGLQHAPVDLLSDPSGFDDLSRRSIRVMGLAYNFITPYGSGFLAEGGLTAEGRHLLRKMADNGLIADVSHANFQTARETLQCIRDEKLPIAPMASHSGIFAVYPHLRNLQGDTLELLHELDGYVGIPLITFFLSSKELAREFPIELLAHLASASSYAGALNVGIGSDCFHGDMRIEESKAEFERMKEMLKSDGKFGEYWPDRPSELITGGSRLFEAVEKMLKKSGAIKQDDVDALLGGNFARYLERALPE